MTRLTLLTIDSTMISRVIISIIELQIREEIYDMLRFDKSKYVECDTQICNFQKKL